MSNVAVTDDVVVLYLTSEELSSRGLDVLISAAQAHALVQNELLRGGCAPWMSMETELFSSGGDLLLIARPVLREVHCFRFGEFEDLLAAVWFLCEASQSELIYYDNSYYLTMKTEYREIPHSVFELGEQQEFSENYAAHLAEHGDVIIGRNAIEVLLREFGNPR